MARRPLDTPRALERRRQLIEAGFDAFADSDYDDVQLDRITSALGVSHGVVFQHFGSKKGFYLAIVEHLLDGFVGCMLTDTHTDDPATVILTNYVAWADEHPRGFASLMRATARFAEIHTLVERTRMAGVEQIAAGEGADPSVPGVRIALRGWIGGLEASVSEWLRDPGTITRKELVDSLRDSLRALPTPGHEKPDL
ncbi:TetR/AcrR family transcriptional regulator [Actinocorallia lasiicapitis]